MTDQLGYLESGQSPGQPDLLDAELFCEKNRIFEIVMIHRGDLFVGVYGVAVARQRVDGHVVFLEGFNKFIVCGFITEENLGIAVSLAGIASGAYLKVVNIDGIKKFESFFERSAAEKHIH